MKKETIKALETLARSNYSLENYVNLQEISVGIHKMDQNEIYVHIAPSTNEDKSLNGRVVYQDKTPLKVRVLEHNGGVVSFDIQNKKGKISKYMFSIYTKKDDFKPNESVGCETVPFTAYENLRTKYIDDAPMILRVE